MMRCVSSTDALQVFTHTTDSCVAHDTRHCDSTFQFLTNNNYLSIFGGDYLSAFGANSYVHVCGGTTMSCLAMKNWFSNRIQFTSISFKHAEFLLQPT